VTVERRPTRQVVVGAVPVGGGAPVTVQSMTITKTADHEATLQQIYALAAAGADIVRCTCNDEAAAEGLARIVPRSPVPIVADIHFQHRLALAALDAGVHCLRLNPGNIRKPEHIKAVAMEAKDRGVPIRIGVNGGSLDPALYEKYGGKVTPEAMVESAKIEIGYFEEVGFEDIKISVKASSVPLMIEAYRLLADEVDFPLHLGVTEAGPAFQGTIKSAVAFGALLAEGIGDTIRVSLSAPPVEEVKVGLAILESLNLMQRGLEIVSCPSCGRAQVDVYTLAEQVTAGLEGLTVPLRVAVMGCVVNGPGEAREADLGVASGNGKGQIFVKGEVIKTVPEAQIVETLIEEALRIAEQYDGPSGEPAVGVS
jgi:(E)-4-hydroxy-3-methylbut-2-enyl-diphosphate synthase